VGEKNLYISSREICKSLREIGISSRDSCISLSEIHISSGEICISLEEIGISGKESTTKIRHFLICRASIHHRDTETQRRALEEAGGGL